MGQKFLKTDNFRALLLNFFQYQIPAEFPAVDAIPFGEAEFCLGPGFFHRPVREFGNQLAEGFVVHLLDVTSDIEGYDFHIHPASQRIDKIRFCQIKYTAPSGVFQSLFIFCGIEGTTTEICRMFKNTLYQFA